MNKIVSLILTVLLVLTLCSCKEIECGFSSSYSFSGASVQNAGQVETVSEEDINSSVVAQSSETPVTTQNNSQKTVVKNESKNNTQTFVSNSTQKEITQEDFDKVVEYFNTQEGLEFSNLSNAKNTDTVSMVNLYLSHDNPMSGKFNALDTKVLDILKNSNEDAVILIPQSELSSDELNEYHNQFYLRRYYNIVTGHDENNVNWYIMVKDTIAKRNALINSSAYKNIQNVISSLGIHKGMLQRDAIVKFNDYICKKVEYDQSEETASLDGFFAGKAICNSYVQVFELLCRSVGIDCKFIGGTAITPQGAVVEHAWNSVRFSDGTVYYFDTCWNDSYITINGKDYQKNDRYMFVTKFGTRTSNSERIVGYYAF